MVMVGGRVLRDNHMIDRPARAAPQSREFPDAKFADFLTIFTNERTSSYGESNEGPAAA
jgi:hypothetical protein